MNVLTSISAHRRPTAPPTAAPIPCLYHRQHLNWATSLEVSAVLVLLFCKSNHTNLRMHSPPSRRIVVRRHHLQHPLYLYPVSATDNTSIGLDRLSAGRESRLNKVRRNGWYHYFLRTAPHQFCPNPRISQRCSRYNTSQHHCCSYSHPFIASRSATINRTIGRKSIWTLDSRRTYP